MQAGGARSSGKAVIGRAGTMLRAGRLTRHAPAARGRLVGLPLLWAWRLARLDEPSTARWLVKAADIAAFLAFVLIARWDILGLHSRNAILAVIALAFSGRCAGTRGDPGPRRRPGRSPEANSTSLRAAAHPAQAHAADIVALGPCGFRAEGLPRATSSATPTPARGRLLDC